MSTPSITSIAVSPDGRFAYVLTRDFSSEPPAVGILGYSIAANGSLTPIGGSPFSSGEFGDIAITPDGRFLYGITGGQVRNFAIDADGKTDRSRSAHAHQRVESRRHPRRPLPVRRNQQRGGRSRLVLDRSGRNPDAQGPPALTGNVGMRLFAVSPDGRYVYMPDNNVNGIVTAAVADSGALTVIGTTLVDDPTSVTVSPDGRFLYYARPGNPGTVGVAAIGADGLATPLPFTAEWNSGEPEPIVFGPGRAGRELQPQFRRPVRRVELRCRRGHPRGALRLGFRRRRLLRTAVRPQLTRTRSPASTR